MSNVVRAWKDETYRRSLSIEEQAMLPVNPAGEIELTDAELEAISGARGRLASLNSDRVEAEQKAPFATNGPVNIAPGLLFVALAPVGNQFGDCTGNNGNEAEAG